MSPSSSSPMAMWRYGPTAAASTSPTATRTFESTGMAARSDTSRKTAEIDRREGKRAVKRPTSSEFGVKPRRETACAPNSARRSRCEMAAGRLLLLLAAAQALHAPFPSGPRLAPARRGALARPPRVGAAVRLSDPPPAAGKLPFFLDINTKGGILFYSAVGIALPFVAYSYMVDVLDLGVVLAGNVILVLYVGLGIVAWTGSYVFRVANKDMTYAQQLKDYENAVIQKRFEELSEEEVDALMGEIYPEKPTEEKK